MTAIILTQCSKGPQWVATFCHWFIQNIDTTPISHSRWKLLNLFLHMEKMFSFLSFSPLLLYLCSSQSMGNKISIALMANILRSETLRTLWEHFILKNKINFKPHVPLHESFKFLYYWYVEVIKFSWHMHIWFNITRIQLTLIFFLFHNRKVHTKDCALYICT